MECLVVLQLIAGFQRIGESWNTQASGANRARGGKS
jgi:hypothetical protein